MLIMINSILLLHTYTAPQFRSLQQISNFLQACVGTHGPNEKQLCWGRAGVSKWWEIGSDSDRKRPITDQVWGSVQCIGARCNFKRIANHMVPRWPPLQSDSPPPSPVNWSIGVHKSCSPLYEKFGNLQIVFPHLLIGNAAQALPGVADLQSDKSWTAFLTNGFFTFKNIIKNVTARTANLCTYNPHQSHSHTVHQI